MLRFTRILVAMDRTLLRYLLLLDDLIISAISGSLVVDALEDWLDWIGTER